MTYLHLAYIHLATVLPALAIGTVMLCMRKGTRLHKTIGRAFMALMFATAAVSMLMPAKVGGRILDHFGDIRTHRNAMVSTYIGMIIAGTFALAPGRLLHNLLFSA